MIFSVTTPGSRWRRAIRQVSAAGDLSFDDGDVVQPEFVVLDIDEERDVLDARAANIVHIYNDDTARTATVVRNAASSRPSSGDQGCGWGVLGEYSVWPQATSG
jgi:hypothetical protein